MSSPSEWVQYHQHQQQQHNPYGQVVSSSNNGTSSTTLFGGQTTDATVTTTTTVTSPSNTTTSSSHGLNPERRVSKPIRRRSRASRRTPTTLLNTDTTNFRAMVQQFTGGVSAPFGSGMSHHYGSSGTNMNFESLHHPIRTTAVMAPAGYNVTQFQQQHQQQQQQQQHMFSLNNNSSTADHGFFQRLSNGNTRPGMEVADFGGGFDKVEGVSSQVFSRPSSSSSNNDNHRSNVQYMF